MTGEPQFMNYDDTAELLLKYVDTLLNGYWKVSQNVSMLAKTAGACYHHYSKFDVIC